MLAAHCPAPVVWVTTQLDLGLRVCLDNPQEVGADRIASNGDTANKIGTYSLAVLAKHHGIPLYIVAPRSTFDMKIKSGKQIPIEERSADEVTHFRSVRTAPSGVKVFNPAFDVTDHSLIAGIVTEYGIIRAPFERNIKKAFKL